MLTILGNIALVTGRWEKAIVWYRRAIKFGTRKGIAYLNLAVLLLRQGAAEEAKALLLRGLSFKNRVINEKNMMLTLGTACWVGGDVDGAIEVLERLRGRFDYVNPSALTTLGYMYFLKGDLDKAEEITQRALDDDGNSGSALDNMGQIYFRRGDNATARDYFIRATENHKNLPDSWYYLGVIAREKGDADGARRYFGEAAACEITALNTVTREMILNEVKTVIRILPKSTQT